MSEVLLVLHGGEQLRILGSYEDISSWFSQTASRTEARQFEIAGGLGNWITVSSAQLVAVIGAKNGG